MSDLNPDGYQIFPGRTEFEYRGRDVAVVEPTPDGNKWVVRFLDTDEKKVVSSAGLFVRPVNGVVPRDPCTAKEPT